MKKCVILDSHTLPADYHQEQEVLRQNGFLCELAHCRTLEEAAAAASDAVCLITNFFPIDAPLLERLPCVKGVVRYGVGYDVIDVDACTAHGVLACNIPHYGAIEVATHTMAMLLALCRKITIFDRSLRSGEWSPGRGYEMRRLSSLTLGLMGFGNIARLFSSMVKPFGMTVLAYDPFLPAEVFKNNDATRSPLDKVFAESDVISIHMPATDETHHLINKDTISTMKHGVMLINTARGPIIDTIALLDAMETGKVQAAALDVFEEEPIRDSNHRMFTQENLILSPHTAYNSRESADSLHVQAGETAAAIMRGEVPATTINKAHLNL